MKEKVINFIIWFVIVWLFCIYIAIGGWIAFMLNETETVSSALVYGAVLITWFAIPVALFASSDM